MQRERCHGDASILKRVLSLGLDIDSTLALEYCKKYPNVTKE